MNIHSNRPFIRDKRREKEGIKIYVNVQNAYWVHSRVTTVEKYRANIV